MDTYVNNVYFSKVVYHTYAYTNYDDTRPQPPRPASCFSPVATRVTPFPERTGAAPSPS